MQKTVLIAEDDDLSRKLFSDALMAEGYRVIGVENGEAAVATLERESPDLMITDVMMPKMDGLTLIARAREMRPEMRVVVMTSFSSTDIIIGALRNRVIDFLSKPFGLDELLSTVEAVTTRCTECVIEVKSGKPDWIEVMLPCDLSVVEPVQKFFSHLQPNLSEEARESIGAVFREMLNNAIEHGGKFDPSKTVTVKFVRFKNMVLYSIKDPGEGFDLKSVAHAAVANPDDQPYLHLQVRKEKGIRPGGFGILLAQQIIDELVYNEKHNELIFVKYLSNSQDG